MSSSPLQQSQSELLRNILAASSTTAFCVALLNPLDVLRIQWQTKPSLLPTQIRERKMNLLHFSKEMVQKQGLKPIYTKGIGVNMASVACSSGIRLGLYPVTRDYLLTMTSSAIPIHLIMFTSGFLSGAFGFFLATPLFTAKIQAQSYENIRLNKSGLECLMNTLKTGPFKGSSILVCRGALFSAGFSFGYDGSKTKVRQLGIKEGPVIHAFASVIAAFIATTCAAPFDAILTRYQSFRLSVPHEPITPLKCVQQMYHTDGLKIFFKGWSLFFSRVAPLFVMQLPLYEQCRKLLGMDFMR
jgi:hypothetical protein